MNSHSHLDRRSSRPRFVGDADGPTLGTDWSVMSADDMTTLTAGLTSGVACLVPVGRIVLVQATLSLADAHTPYDPVADPYMRAPDDLLPPQAWPLAQGGVYGNNASYIDTEGNFRLATVDPISWGGILPVFVDSWYPLR